MEGLLFPKENVFHQDDDDDDEEDIDMMLYVQE
jgi:hypothetical protein